MIRAQINNAYGLVMVQQSQVITVVGDQYPSLNVISPQDVSTHSSATAVKLSAIANDTEDGDISLNIQWSSSINGLLGSGRQLDVLLGAGNHIITISITDSAGNTIQVTRQITVAL